MKAQTIKNNENLEQAIMNHDLSTRRENGKNEP